MNCQLGNCRTLGLLLVLFLSHASYAREDDNVVSIVRLAADGAGSAQTLLPDGRVLKLERASGEPEAVILSEGKRSTLALRVPRFAATATVLPNGKVLIWGGIDAADHIVAAGEWFDPATNQLAEAAVNLLPRAGHTATVLTDGRLLVTGGWNDRVGALTEAELWDYRTNKSDLLATDLVPPRNGHAAMLLADGRVLIVGGYDPDGRRFRGGSLFDPAQVRFLDVDAALAGGLKADAGTTELAGSIPVNDATDFPLDGLIALRFSASLDVTSLNDKTVTLIGSAGAVAIRVVPAEGGRLLFVKPASDLLPGTSYTLFVSGGHRSTGEVLPFTALSFTTSASTGETADNLAGGVLPSSEKDPNGVAHSANAAGPSKLSSSVIRPVMSTGSKEALVAFQASCTNTKTIHGYRFCHEAGTVQDGIFIPGHSNAEGRWKADPTVRIPIASPKMTSESERKSETTVIGSVHRVDDRPLARATVSIAGFSTQTDSAGHFTLHGVPTGQQTLLVDGSTANRSGEEYGEFYVAVNVAEKRQNEMPFVLYVPRITALDKVTIPTPVVQDTVISHPAIPGLEIHIPAGTVLRGRRGNILTEVAIVPMPADRSPVPLPADFPVYFSMQPATAVVENTSSEASSGINLVYPNYLEGTQGRQQLFWLYDVHRDGWMVYSNGHLSGDEAQVFSDSSLGLNMPVPGGNSVGGTTPTGGSMGCFSGGSGPPPRSAGASGPASSGNPTGQPESAGDPVDCFTGLFVFSRTDFSIPDITSIGITRTYRQSWDVPMPFGRGVSFNYGLYLYNPSGLNQPPEVDLVLPDGAIVPFTRISGNLAPGGPGLWVSYTRPDALYGARLINDETDLGVGNSDTCGICILLRDGTTLRFPDMGTSSNPSWLQWIKDRFGNKVALSYSGSRPSSGYSSPQISSVTSPGGRSLTFTWGDTYNSVQYVTTVTEKDSSGNPGRTVTYHHTSGQLTTVSYPDGTTEQYTYYPNTNNLWKFTDRRGNLVVTNTYDAATPFNRVTQQTLPDGSYNFSYHSGYTDVTDPRGNVRHIVFDSKGYPISVTRANNNSTLAQTTTFVRGQNELITLKTDSLGRRTENVYDPNGNLVSQTLLASTSSAVTYFYGYTADGNNQLGYTLDPLNHSTNYSYADGCLNSISDALGNTTSVVCNAHGQPTAVTDANGNTTTYTYGGSTSGGPFDLSTITDALGNTTTLSSDNMGRATSVLDPQGNRWQYSYDTTGQTRYLVDNAPISSTDPLNRVITLAYDGNGNLASVTDPLNHTTQYGYDARNRRTSRTDALLHQETWQYDGVGNLLNRTDRKGQQTNYQYDALDRPSVITYQDGKTITLTFDSGNRLTNVVDTGDTGAIGRAYDMFDRLTQEQTPRGTVNYTYDNAGRRSTMTPVGQGVITYNFDAVDRLVSMNQGSETVSFAYDSAGRRTSTILPNGVVGTYQYDSVDELLGVFYAGSSALLSAIQYSYDASGRVVNSTNPASNPTTTTSSSNFDANNRQTSYDGTTLSYDANGNLISDGSRTYIWDARDRLVMISGAVTATFAYDAFGRRYGKFFHNSVTYFLYDGANPIQETVGSNVYPILTGPGIDERYARSEPAGRYYFLTDNLGSTIALTNSSANITQSYSYEPYGEVTSTGTSNNLYQYTGRENDGTGLYYYRARYYSPTLKRFISEDPIGFAAGLNSYAYVDDDPLDDVDPSGLSRRSHSKKCGDVIDWIKKWVRKKFPTGELPQPKAPMCPANVNYSPLKPFPGMDCNAGCGAAMDEKIKNCLEKCTGPGAQTLCIDSWSEQKPKCIPDYCQ